MNDRKRSPSYPSFGLSESLEGIRRFYIAEKRTAVDSETAAKALGYSSLSGAARVKLATLKQYGLLTGRGDRLAISDLGLQVVLPSSEADYNSAVRQAALNPELFKQLWESHAEASTNAVVSYLVRELGFSEDSARRLDRSFRETLRFAQLEAGAYNAESEDPINAMPSSSDDTIHSLATPLLQSAAPKGSNTLAMSVPYAGGSLSVQVTVAPGERLTRKLMEKVVKFLTLVTEDLPEDGNGESEK